MPIQATVHSLVIISIAFHARKNYPLFKRGKKTYHKNFKHLSLPNLKTCFNARIFADCCMKIIGKRKMEICSWN